MIYISNSFSLQMLNHEHVSYVEVTPIEIEEVKKLISKCFISTIGHPDTARLLTTLLGTHMPYDRINIKLNLEDVLIVAQVVGGRLPEGCTTLPEGIEIKFFKVCLVW